MTLSGPSPGTPARDLRPERRWLILSYFSNIDGMACAHHLDDRIPHLDREGVTPLLLTGPCGLRREDIVHVRVPSAALSGLRFEMRHLVRRSGRNGGWNWKRQAGAVLHSSLLPFYLLEKALVGLDSQWSWFFPAWLTGRSLLRRYRPELIYSTGGAPSAHVAAGMLSRRARIPWIAEIQDPLVHDDWRRGPRARAAYRWLERFICRNADLVVFVTEGARDRTLLRTGLGDRGFTLYPGAEPNPYRPPGYRKGDHCRFAHFGSLAGSRNVKVFLAALDLLARDFPKLADVVRLDLYGTCDRFSRTLAREFPRPGVVTVHGRVPRADSLAAMRRADVLLLIQNTEDYSAETIPFKTYEYFQAGRPVLGLVQKNVELREMLERLGHVAADAADPATVREGIVRCLTAWTEGASGALSPYTVAAAVGALVDRSNAVISNRSAKGCRIEQGKHHHPVP